MIINYIKNFIFILIISTNLDAFSAVDISKDTKDSLLKHSSIYFDTDSSSTIQEIIKHDLFKPYEAATINTGVSKTTTWVKFKLYNSGNLPIEKLLVLNSPILEQLELYTDATLNSPILKGTQNISSEHTTIYHTFLISLESNQSKTYYLKVKSIWAPIGFSMALQDEKNYRTKDKNQQLIKIILLSMIVILMIYSFILSFYSKDKSYLYYSFYLLTLIYHQSNYLGLTKIYLPLEFIQNIEIKMALTKVALMIVSASLFAIYFLKTIEIPFLHRIYKVFIFIALLEIVILNIPQFYNFQIVILTSAMLIIFNLIAATISYKRGNKQARLFILGFGIVFISYVLIMANALGLTSFVQDFPNSLVFGTTLEALILSLAFVDRYAILTKEKEIVDKNILNETQNREGIVKQEVVKKTTELNQALKAKDLLLKEVHHRIKNNLQIILSIVRLQSDEIEDKIVTDKFINLENRINAIAKIYNMLIIDENLDEIDMEGYIEELLLDIKDTMPDIYENIKIETEIDISLPLNKSIYIGIIINELVTNSYKYAFENNKGTIFISLHKKMQEYILIIRDNGKGFIYDKEEKSLGLNLIHTLVSQQLKGKIEMLTEGMTQYTIRFTV
jgi:two-component sensor histidine kinase